MAEDINIRIKSTSDTKGFKEVSKAGEEVANTNKKVSKTAQDATKSFKDYAMEIPGVGAAMRLLTNPVALLAAAFTSLGVAVRAALKEFSAAQVQSSRLDAALAQSGRLTDNYRESLHELAAAMQDATGVADDQWLEAIRKLTQFGATEQNIGSLIEGVKNLAGIMDGDLSGAADLVGRALQGNYEVLGRYGIQAKEMTTLLQELATKGAGQLEARSKTLTGTWQNLKNQTNDLLEGIGGMINRTGVLKVTIDTVADAFRWWVDLIGNVQDRLPGLTNAVDSSTESQSAAAQATKRYAEENAKLDETLKGITESLKQQNEEIDKRKSRDERIAEAAKRAEMARVDASGLSAPAKEQAKFEIESRYAAQADRRENAAVVAKATAQATAITDMQREEAALAAKEKQLEAQIKSGRDQARINQTIERNKIELENTMKAMELAKKVEQGPVPLATAVKAELEAEKLGFDYNSLNTDKLSKRAQQLQRVIAGDQYAATTVAQDEAQLAEVRTRRTALQGQIAPQRKAFRDFQSEQVEEFDTRQTIRAFDNEARAQNAMASVGTGRQQVQQQVAGAITSGQQVDASLSALLAEYEAVYQSMKRKLDEAVNTIKNTRDNGR